MEQAREEAGLRSEGAAPNDEVESARDQANLREVVAMLLEDGEPQLEAQFVGTHTLQVA